MNRTEETAGGGPDISVPQSDITDLTLLDRSDRVFAVIYALLFLWGLVLTLISI